MDLIDWYLAHLRAAGYSGRTIRDRRYVLERAHRELPVGLDAAATHEVEAWLGAQPLARWSLCRYWSDLYQFYAWSVRSGLLDWSPMTDLPRPRMPPSEPRPATEHDVAVGLALPAPWRTAVILAAFQGLRVAEIARLRREQVTIERLTVLRKGGKIQQLPTHPLTWEAVRDLPDGPAVPRWRRGGHYAPQWLTTALRRRLTAAGAPGVTPHRYRHRYATALLDAGASIRTVQELLGHASVTSTQVYTQVTDAARRAAILALPIPGDLT